MSMICGILMHYAEFILRMLTVRVHLKIAVSV